MSICFFVSLPRGLAILLIFSKNQHLVALIFFSMDFFLFSISLISDPIFIISSLSYFRCILPFIFYVLEEGAYIIREFSSFLVYAFNVINFPLSTALAVSWIPVRCVSVILQLRIFSHFPCDFHFDLWGFYRIFIFWRRPSRWRRSKTWRSPSSPQIHLHVEQLLQNTYWMLAEDLRLPKRQETLHVPG